MPSSKNYFGLSFVGLKEISEKLEKLGASVEETTELAMKQSKKYLNNGIEQAMNSSKFDFNRPNQGETRRSLDKSDHVYWDRKTALIDVGFDLDDGGLPSIFLMYGTPQIEPDRKLFSAIFGSKTKKQVRQIQESVFYEALRKAELV